MASEDLVVRLFIAQKDEWTAVFVRNCVINMVLMSGLAKNTLEFGSDLFQCRQLFWVWYF